jgi:hypothetical protein
MGTAYTPGLTVTPKTVLRRMRRLPLKGDVLVKIGDLVEPSTIVARAALPGVMQSVKVAAQLGIEVSDLGGALKVSIGDSVEKGQILAESKSFFGLFKSESKSPVTGTVETISHTSGNIGVRQKLSRQSTVKAPQWKPTARSCRESSEWAASEPA